MDDRRLFGVPRCRFAAVAVAFRAFDREVAELQRLLKTTLTSQLFDRLNRLQVVDPVDAGVLELRRPGSAAGDCCGDHRFGRPRRRLPFPLRRQRRPVRRRELPSRRAATEPHPTLHAQALRCRSCEQLDGCDSGRVFGEVKAGRDLGRHVADAFTVDVNRDRVSAETEGFEP